MPSCSPDSVGMYSKDVRRGANHMAGNKYCTILSALMPLSSCANWSRRTEASRRHITCAVRSSGRPALMIAIWRLARLSVVGPRRDQGPRQATQALLGILSRECFSRRANGQAPSWKFATPLRRLERTSRLDLPGDTTRQPAVLRGTAHVWPAFPGAGLALLALMHRNGDGKRGKGG